MPPIEHGCACAPQILVGLVFSVLGDAFLVWQSSGYFLHGLFMFTAAHVMYVWAFGLRPLRLWLGGIGSVCSAIAYALLYPGLSGPMVFLAGMYIALICFMAWRAAARVQVLPRSEQS